MESRPLKRIDILRHELKALRFMLDNYHAGKIDPASIPPREDFQSDQGKRLYDIILGAPSRAAAEKEIGELELDEVDIESFLRNPGEILEGLRKGSSLPDCLAKHGVLSNCA